MLVQRELLKQFFVKGWFDNGFGKYPNSDPEPPIAELHPKVPESCCDPSKDTEVGINILTLAILFPLKCVVQPLRTRFAR